MVFKQEWKLVAHCGRPSTGDRSARMKDRAVRVCVWGIFEWLYIAKHAHASSQYLHFFKAIPLQRR